MNKRYFVAALFLLAFLMQHDIVSAITINPTQNIQEIINSINENDTIYFEPGIYNQTFVVNKSLRLIGLNRKKTIIYGSNFIYHPNVGGACTIFINDLDVNEYGIPKRQDVIGVLADNVIISNLTINNSRGYGNDALIWLNADNVTIVNINLFNGCKGCLLYTSPSPRD